MEIKIVREHVTKEATLGRLFINGEFECYTLEDLPRKRKIKHETCIPTGTYEVKFREVVTPMTERYRKKYSWFKWHLEIMQVPDFTDVYLHIGNKSRHSSGCILVGQTQDVKESFIGHSMFAFKALYQKMSKELESGLDITIEIEDH